MKRKLIKYTKFVVSVALILSLVAPSYAALSASDGSAFVTKAEFDSALADFNSRLTTFEAGINSKIDSQVTSYLDRNGIWSAKQQVLNERYGWFCPTRELGSKEGGVNKTWPYTWSNISWKGETRRYVARHRAVNAPGAGGTVKKTLGDSDFGKKMVWWDADFTLVDEISKAGLCCLVISYAPFQTLYAKSGTRYRTSICVGPNNRGDNDSANDGASSLLASFGWIYTNTWIDETEAKGKYDWCQHGVIGDSFGFVVNPVTGVSTLYFFVNSRDKLCLKLEHAAIPTVSGSLKAIGNKSQQVTDCFPLQDTSSGVTNDFPYAICGTTYNVDSCAVY